jgi:phage internal scaffolding protein
MFYIPHDPVTTDCGDEVITKQSLSAECDIHNILKQYHRTGIITHLASGRPEYVDLPSDIDYQQSLNTIIAAEAAFAELPATVRDYFANDPGRFLAAFEDESQLSKLRELGLVQPANDSSPPSAVSAGGGPGGAT